MISGDPNPSNEPLPDGSSADSGETRTHSTVDHVGRIVIVTALVYMAVYFPYFLFLMHRAFNGQAVLPLAIFPAHLLGMALNSAALVLTIRDLYLRAFRNPNAKLTWLLVILMTGGVGWLIYVLMYALKPRVPHDAKCAEDSRVPLGTELVSDEVAANPYAAPQSVDSGGASRARRNWRDYSPEYNRELRSNGMIQGLLGVLTALILDGGVAFRTFLVAALGYWLMVAMLLVRRPMTPTWIDLQLVRWGILPLFIIVVFLGPILLHLTGLYP